MDRASFQLEQLAQGFEFFEDGDATAFLSNLF